MQNSETVRQIYGAFQRGDIAAILDRLAEDVEWEYAIAPAGVPWLQPRRGRAAVPGFFAAMSGFELHQFEPKMLLENGNVVVALIDVDLTVTATGTRITEKDEVHIWYFDPHGRVERFGHKLDTHRHWIACGSPAAVAAG